MKKSPRQLIAIAALAAIVLLVTAFVISAFTAGPGEAGNRFMALLFGIISYMEIGRASCRERV